MKTWLKTVKAGDHALVASFGLVAFARYLLKRAYLRIYVGVALRIILCHFPVCSGLVPAPTHQVCNEDEQ